MAKKQLTSQELKKAQRDSKPLLDLPVKAKESKQVELLRHEAWLRKYGSKGK